MNKSPAFQFYAADYLADENVQLMTLEEEGAYVRALAYCWREGSIPSDPDKLSRLLKNCSNQCSTVVRKCFNQCSNDASRLTHPRLEREREKQRVWREKSAQAGVKSGKARRLKTLTNEPTLNQPSNVGCDLVEPKTNSSFAFASSSSSFKKTKTFIPPSWVNQEQWDSFVEMRKKKRSPLTYRAAELVVLQLEKLQKEGHIPGDVLDQSIRRGYLDVFPIHQNGNGGSNGNGFNRAKTGGNREAARQAMELLGFDSTHVAGGSEAGEREPGHVGPLLEGNQLVRPTRH